MKLTGLTPTTSIILAIINRIETRQWSRGGNTNIRWVHSHAQGEHILEEQLLNDDADRHAERARRGEVTITQRQECFRFLPIFYLTTKCTRPGGG